MADPVWIDFENVNDLPDAIILYRLNPQDPNASVETYNIPNGSGTVDHRVRISTSIADSTVVALLAAALSVTELEILYGPNQKELADLPDWATWTPTQAFDNITGAIFAGQTQAQVDAYIDATATTLAGARTVLHQMASAIITIRSILANIGKVLAVIRSAVFKIRA